MNRRELIGAAVVGLATQSIAQNGVTIMPGAKASCHQAGENLVCTERPSAEERKLQYAICKQRGHAAGIGAPENNLGWMQPSWSTCRYCWTQFRFVTTMEEENAPAV